MELKIIDQEFSVCKVGNLSQIDYSDDFLFLGKTDEELSVVCSTKFVPSNATECEHGWKAFRIEGVLDFSLVGIMAKISAVLAEHQIGIFVISTFNTDYVLTKGENFEKAMESLRQAGYVIK